MKGISKIELITIILTAIAAVAAVASAIFTRNTWQTAEKTLNYTKTKEAPDLWMKKDVFVWEEYEITQLSLGGQPNGIPAKSIVLQQFPVKEIETGNLLNRTCLIMNSSSKSSSNAQIDNYSGLFGEVHFENRGTVAIKEIEIANCHFKMRENTGYDLQDFDLTPVGKLDVDIERGEPFIIFVGYLFDNDEHRICDPRYMDDEGLREDAMQKKRMYDDQLRCYLDVIIDLYDEMTFTLRFTAQDGSVYEQEHSVKIELAGNGGIYKPVVKEAVLVEQ